MRVYDELTQGFVPKCACARVITGITSGIIIFGYVSSKEGLTQILVKDCEYGENNVDFFPALIDLTKCKAEVLYSNFRGKYFLKEGLTQDQILKELLIKGQGGFPYTFERFYEAVNNFELFNGKQEVLDKNFHSILGKNLKYTFGIEFETSQGYIPEDICFRDGLIPLRDGSITGLEYSTVILEGEQGLALLKQQLDTLRNYTNFNKECSLHIHFGNYPLTTTAIYNLYYICLVIEGDIKNIVPPYTFESSRYKANEKDYCKLLPNFSNFDEMYSYLVGRNFYGNFTQPHPNDIKRCAKWRIPTRYYWINFINALCYNVNKTIEFRLLRPSYNYYKILLWIYIFNAILSYAEQYKGDNIRMSSFTLKDIIKEIYPEDISHKVLLGIVYLHIICRNQATNRDFIGSETFMEDEFFNPKLGL